MMQAPGGAVPERVTPAKRHATASVDLRWPFTRAAALRYGFDPRRRPKEYRRLFHGVYLHTAIEPTPLMMAKAVLLTAGEKAWASHATAARLLGVPIPALPGEHVTVLDKAERRARVGLTTHYVRRGLVSTVAGTRVSAPAQLFVELATQLSLVDLVVVGDHLVRKGLATCDELRTLADAATGAGAALARRAAAYVRERVDSPMETRLRMLLVLAGLPEPEVNQLVGDETERRRYDLSYRTSRTIIEYDGKHHVEREEQWESDIRRREKIDDDGWRILVFIAKDIYKTPSETLERIHRVLLDRGEPGVPSQLSHAWRDHFPSQG